MQRTWISPVVLGLGVLFSASAAHAGPVEQLRQLTFQPGAPDNAILRYDNGGDGLFYSHDGTKSFGLLCTAGIDPALTRGGPIMLASDGKTLMGVFDGMYEDDGKGCSWSRVKQFDKVWISDFALDPTDPSITYAVSSNGNAGSMNGIFQRDKDGNWTDLGSRDDILIGRLHVVSTGDGKLRFYESAARGTRMTDAGISEPNYLIRVSDDGGKTWEEHAFDADGAASMRLVAIDPTNPDRLVVTVDRDPDDDSVLVSDDAGASFTEYLKVTQVGGVTFAPDGRVWIGDSGDTTNPKRAIGLWAAASLDEPAKMIGNYVVQCLTYEPTSETLYACQHWWLGTADPKSGEFTSFFKLTEAKSFLDCEGRDMPMVCKTQLCGAYCGAGHFAQAPLCNAYSDPTCGPAVAEGGGGGGTGGTNGGSGGMPAPAGSGGMLASGGSGGGAGGNLGHDVIDAGTAGTGGGKKKSSGCSVSALGAEPRSVAWLGVLGAALLPALRRRRRA